MAPAEGRDDVREYDASDHEQSGDEEPAPVQRRAGRIDSLVKRKGALKGFQDKEKGTAWTGEDEEEVVPAGYQTTNQILEEFLDKEKHSNIVLVWIRRVLGITRVQKAVKVEQWKRMQPDYVHKFPWAQRLANSVHFEAAVGVIMLINGGLIGWEASVTEEELENLPFDPLENAFTAVFLLELTLRVLADGWIWFMRLMNFLDALVIFGFGVVPLWVLKPAGVESSDLRAFTVVRSLRLIRVVRMIRMVSVFRLLWKLVRGFLDSGRILLSTYAMIFCVLYIFSVFSVHWIARTDSYIDDDLAQEYFGNMNRAMVTWFQVATLDGWAKIARQLMSNAPEKATTVCGLFIAVILLVTLMLLNLVTAAIVNNTLNNSSDDVELTAKLAQDAMEAELDELSDIFLEIDDDGNGMLSKEEYDYALRHNDRVQEKFASLQISLEESEDIWNILDAGAGELSVKEFADGVRALKGEARAKDSFIISKAVRRLNGNLIDVGQQLKEHGQLAERVRKKAARVHREFGGVLVDLLDFVEQVGQCVPTAPAPRQKADIEKLEKELANKVLEYQNYA